jgi:hypothetical protein
MLTYYSTLATEWHKSLIKVQQYMKTKPHSKTYAPVKSSKPLSTANRVPKSDGPVLVPHYTPSLARSDSQVDSIRSYLHILKNSINANISSTATSDDGPIILDSGCSITVTNDPSNFVPNSLCKSYSSNLRTSLSVPSLIAPTIKPCSQDEPT